ncbi:MAG: hypothetical protein LBD60_01710 [Puniceicoccales bacterium]|nr:hypothetical protein [Puniceicoccales bacterium]
MDFQNIIAAIRENRNDFERDLELLVKRLLTINGAIRAALFIVAMVFGRRDLMEKIRHYEETQWNTIWDDDTIFGWLPVCFRLATSVLCYIFWSTFFF